MLDFPIVAQYQTEFRGIAGYYQLAFNVHRLGRLKYVMQRSLVKTLARKYRVRVSQDSSALPDRTEDRPGPPSGTPGHRRTRRRAKAVGGAVGRSFTSAQDQDRQSRRPSDAGVEQRAQ
ncbi:group II intron reverse transcriptase/maturase [Streptomyces sp. NBC_00461]|uniref:group II intron reverse transcriptase/maturase n=1 Tax=Streptomyces sp. NBC_00461 TaxID=2975750 RepID=UPI003FCD14D9